MSNDWVIRYDTRCFQVARQSRQTPARSTVLVREAVTGAIELGYRGRLMRWTEIPAPPATSKPAPVAARPSPVPRGTPFLPSGDHPWRRGYAERAQRALDRARP